MADTAYICGAFAELRSDSDTPYIYQDVRFDGFRPLSLQRHIELMDIVSWRLRNRATGLAAKRIAEIAEELLRRNNYPGDRTNIVSVRSHADGTFSVICRGTSLYDSLTLRAIHPEAVVVECGTPFTWLPTSAGLAQTLLLREYAAANGAGTFIGTDSSGRIVTIDGSTPFAARGRRIIAPESIADVEAEKMLRAAAKAGREIETRSLSAEELPTLDELFCIDARGITAISECDGTVYSDIVTEAVSRLLE